jgi:hypothetical protein
LRGTGEGVADARVRQVASRPMAKVVEGKSMVDGICLVAEDSV